MQNDITFAVCEKCHGLNRLAFDYPLGKSPVCGKCKAELNLRKGISDLRLTSLDLLTAKCPLPVVVDFWAPWCGPCRSFAPTFIEAAKQLKGQVVFGKVDTQADPQAGQKFEVKGIPTLIIFMNGQEASRISGALQLDELLKWISHTAQVRPRAGM